MPKGLLLLSVLLLAWGGAAAQPRRRVLSLRLLRGAGAEGGERHRALLSCRAAPRGPLRRADGLRPGRRGVAAARRGLRLGADAARRGGRRRAPCYGATVAGGRGGTHAGRRGGDRCRGCGRRRTGVPLRGGGAAEALPRGGALRRARLPCRRAPLGAARGGARMAPGGRRRPAHGARRAHRGGLHRCCDGGSEGRQAVALGARARTDAAGAPIGAGYAPLVGGGGLPHDG